MKNAFATALFFSLLAPVLPAQERVEHIVLNSKTGTKMSSSDAAAFWARIRETSANTVKRKDVAPTKNLVVPTVSDAPGVMEVVGPFDDDNYVRVRFLSRRLEPGSYVCVGWRYTPSQNSGIINEIPTCIGSSLYSFDIAMELFKGYMTSYEWTGFYRYDAFVSINNRPPIQVTGFANLDTSPDSSVPVINDVSISGNSSPTRNGGPNLNITGDFTAPLVFYDGREIGPVVATPTGLAIQDYFLQVGRLVTLCDSGVCTTQVVYKF